MWASQNIMCVRGFFVLVVFSSPGVSCGLSKHEWNILNGFIDFSGGMLFVPLKSKRVILMHGVRLHLTTSSTSHRCGLFLIYEIEKLDLATLIVGFHNHTIIKCVNYDRVGFIVFLLRFC